MKQFDIVVIGGGPAGLAAAIGARKAGAHDILILERDNRLGGILNQCIHNGFGLHTFNEELTGPEYAARFIDELKALDITYWLNTMVIEFQKDKIITAVNEKGLHMIKAKAVVLAMGCRERSRGQINIPGSRPAGIFTAGTAQKFVNLDGYLPGREAVILGSGDIGLIMARRLTLEGATVKAVAEILPYSSGLKRNVVQCLNDFDIPLLFSHTVTEVLGGDRVTGVLIARVDEEYKPLPHTQRRIDCDTLLLSVGLIPENELSRMAQVRLSPITNGPIVNESFQTNVDGVFACGNALHVHDLVDFVSEESEAAGANAAKYVQGANFTNQGVPLHAAEGVRYIVPERIHFAAALEYTNIRFRVDGVYRDAYVCLYFDDNRAVRRRKIILTPGEMETITISKKLFEEYYGAKKITIRVEKGANL